MREIKFRGLGMEGCSYSNKWFYGYLTIDGNHTLIWEGKSYPVLVDRETIGQYTGLLDKNGKEIYEWDKVGWKNPDLYGIVKFGYYNNGDYYEDRIAGNGWYLERYYEGRVSISELDDRNCYTKWHKNLSCKVIGNVNPKLLKKNN